MSYLSWAWKMFVNEWELLMAQCQKMGINQPLEQRVLVEKSPALSAAQKRKNIMR